MSYSTLKIFYKDHRFLSIGIIIFNRSNDDFLHQLPSTAQAHVMDSSYLYFIFHFRNYNAKVLRKSSNNSAKKNVRV